MKELRLGGLPQKQSLRKLPYPNVPRVCRKRTLAGGGNQSPVKARQKNQ